TLKFGKERAGKHKNGSGSNPSPVCSEEGVFVYYKSGDVAAVSHQGVVRWSRNIQKDHGPDTLWWDLGTSPVLVDGKLVVAVMQEGESYIVALGTADGELAWKQPRQYQRPTESDHAYTTPQVVDIDGRPTLVVWGADHLTGHDVQTGELLWDVTGFNPTEQAN
ncbi:MAG: PQQ-binding-like beta-propeller repeat protein, partial [Planctomycetales bacterium]|nr:PQQ-binding-like beta-propeller repeat protein [Planctomycetales bacterium]